MKDYLLGLATLPAALALVYVGAWALAETDQWRTRREIKRRWGRGGYLNGKPYVLPTVDGQPAPGAKIAGIQGGKIRLERVDPAKIKAVAFGDLLGPELRTVRGGARYPTFSQLRTASPDEPVTENLSAYIDGEIRRSVMAAMDDYPDPDKDDCPVWLPQDPAVPHADRTPCHLDAGHSGDHQPMDKGTLDRARGLRTLTSVHGWSWEHAAQVMSR